MTGATESAAISFAVPPELVETIAERVVEILAADQPSTAADGWLRGANQIADYVGCPRSRVYALASARRIPIERDGSSLLAKRSTLDGWIRSGAGSPSHSRPPSGVVVVARFPVSK